MENEKINVQLNPVSNELTIRKGDAPPIYLPESISIVGTIDAPINFIIKRQYKSEQSYVLVDENAMNIIFHGNTKEIDTDTISGHLILNPDFIKWGFNKDKTYTTFELSDFIKMNRFCFSEKSKAMKLVTQLREFKAKITTNVEKRDDLRGNSKQLYETQLISESIPESFELVMQIFKGEPTHKFNVEIAITGQYECYLISPEIIDYIKEYSLERITEIIIRIKEFNGDIPIIYV